MSVSPGFRLPLLALVIIAGGCAVSPPPAEELPAPTVSEPPSTPEAAPLAAPESIQALPAEITVIAVGDIMPGTDYPENRLPENDGADLFKEVAPVLGNADITFGNLEGTLMDGGEAVKTCKGGKNCYVFRTPARYVQRLVEAGFDVMSLANNHARDFGERGRTASMQALASAGILQSGREGEIASWVVKGRRVAMIAYAPFGGAHDPSDIELAQKTVSGLASQHDIVIVSMHMGAEGEDAAHLTFKPEIFHGEDRGDSVRFARAVIDAGADLVIGHGPHVPRAVELYRGRLIAYSLGNFCTYFGINVAGKNGLAPILEVKLGPDGQFQAGRIISARQVRPTGPLLDETHAAARLMARLTAEDFPEGEIMISPEGQILLKERAATSGTMDDKSSPAR